MLTFSDAQDVSHHWTMWIWKGINSALSVSPTSSSGVQGIRVKRHRLSVGYKRGSGCGYPITHTPSNIRISLSALRSKAASASWYLVLSSAAKAISYDWNSIKAVLCSTPFSLADNFEPGVAKTITLPPANSRASLAKRLYAAFLTGFASLLWALSIYPLCIVLLPVRDS